jgi:UDP-2-acetamido-2,6-beta-L-arabino-hexul-4-ose reductase
MLSPRNDPAMRVLVTGSIGFIGRNLVVRLGELPGFEVVPFVRADDAGLLPDLVARVDAVVHLAGENRPKDERDFFRVNTDLTVALCDAIRKRHELDGQYVPLLIASSIQAERDTLYGRSKLAAEVAVAALSRDTENPCAIMRLPSVFGKWCRPNYNSVVATFCHNIARGIPIRVDDPQVKLRLAYVDDVLESFVAFLRAPGQGLSYPNLNAVGEISLGGLAAQISAFRDARSALSIARVGDGLTRALYATYLSYIPEDTFSYAVPLHSDPRGDFVEIIKTPDSGQFSYLTAGPGVTRGGHYHHTKVEKFLVIRGDALFRLRHILTNQTIEIRTSGTEPRVVETIPGWAHDITNIGSEELVVFLWANEVFDPKRPDTFACRVSR